MKNTKKIFILLIVLLLLVEILPIRANAGGKWTNLDSNWKIRLDPPAPGDGNKWHVHVENNDGSIKGTENVDGTKHDGDQLKKIPKKIKEKARNSKTYKKGKENQAKTNAAKAEVTRRGLHWGNVLQVAAIIAILVLFGIACYFTGGAAALVFA